MLHTEGWHNVNSSLWLLNGPANKLNVLRYNEGLCCISATCSSFPFTFLWYFHCSLQQQRAHINNSILRSKKSSLSDNTVSANGRQYAEMMWQPFISVWHLRALFVCVLPLKSMLWLKSLRMSFMQTACTRNRYSTSGETGEMMASWTAHKQKLWI